MTDTQEYERKGKTGKWTAVKFANIKAGDTLRKKATPNTLYAVEQVEDSKTLELKVI